MEKCVKCGKEVEDGMLIRDPNDAAVLHCNGCLPEVEPKPERRRRRPRKAKEEPMKLVMIEPISVPQSAEPSVSLDQIRESAEKVAIDCGLVPPFHVTGPTRMDYNRSGHGYTVTLTEVNGPPGKRARMGSALFQSDGKFSMWTLDGVLGGS